ncbi:hypothetical protein [Streptococcus danieliae]|uniref:Uncharacterized protein n=1 Tax=Streptococcus danieliae TaxID=747656 RepID=A0A7Z0S4P0_9STRE|nr:hypothetical protein [Streptococcus danieliae]MBF0699425.1 hypothetical protein [Streptococcus danieliae]NYS96601.1 hypothetical protein [Streptococcus danieliae]
MAKNAFYTQAAKATKGKGKNIRSAYETFEDFFDYDAEIQNLFRPTEKRSRIDRMSELNRLMNEYLEKEDDSHGI